jgi:hypothetical protein
MAFRLLFFIIQILSLILSTIAIEKLKDRIIHAVGSEEQLILEVEKIAVHASELRNGTDNVIQLANEGATGFVFRVTFADGVRWAAKVSESKQRLSMQQALTAVEAIETYCPDISVPKFHSRVEPLSNSSLYYYLTDWVEGDPLGYAMDYKYTTFSSFEITMPEKVVLQLAEFVYNVTTCPIPIENCMGPLRLYNLPFPVERMVTTSLNSFWDSRRGRIPSTIAWAKEKFVENRKLLTSEPSPPELSGMDKLLLLAWVTEQLRDTDQEPFVLHHWDLRPPNVFIDEHQNIVGYNLSKCLSYIEE